MRRSAARTLALAVAPVFVLAGCSGGLTGPETDACNSVAAWISGGREPDDLARAVTRAQAALADVAETVLAAPLAVLETSTAPDDQAINADAFMTVCTENGWELPEG